MTRMQTTAKAKEDVEMADCFSLPNVSLIDRHILENLNEEDTAFRHVISEYGWKVWFDKRFITDYVSHLKFTIEALLAENAKMKAERDAAVAAVEELNDDFVECVCSNYGNLSPYCGNRCEDCVDERGWCKEVTKYCHGFIPMAYKDWRGIKESE